MAEYCSRNRHLSRPEDANYRNRNCREIQDENAKRKKRSNLQMQPEPICDCTRNGHNVEVSSVNGLRRVAFSLLSRCDQQGSAIETEGSAVRHRTPKQRGLSGDSLASAMMSNSIGIASRRRVANLRPPSRSSPAGSAAQRSCSELHDFLGA